MMRKRCCSVGRSFQSNLPKHNKQTKYFMIKEVILLYNVNLRKWWQNIILICSFSIKFGFWQFPPRLSWRRQEVSSSTSVTMNVIVVVTADLRILTIHMVNWKWQHDFSKTWYGPILRVFCVNSRMCCQGKHCEIPLNYSMWFGAIDTRNALTPVFIHTIEQLDMKHTVISSPCFK